MRTREEAKGWERASNPTPIVHKLISIGRLEQAQTRDVFRSGLSALGDEIMDGQVYHR